MDERSDLPVPESQAAGFAAVRALMPPAALVALDAAFEAGARLDRAEVRAHAATLMLTLEGAVPVEVAARLRAGGLLGVPCAGRDATCWFWQRALAPPAPRFSDDELELFGPPFGGRAPNRFAAPALPSAARATSRAPAARRSPAIRPGGARGRR